jgi:hypothetical protein
VGKGVVKLDMRQDFSLEANGEAVKVTENAVCSRM